VPGSYELHLFRLKPGTKSARIPQAHQEGGKELGALDQRAIGDFLLSLGHQLRFGAHTALGEQYIYEDERGGTMEIIVGEKQVSVGFPNWYRGEEAQRMQRLAYAISLAVVARFDLTLYDPQTGRFLRGARATDQSQQ
jgi:hypothetical protein